MNIKTIVVSGISYDIDVELFESLKYMGCISELNFDDLEEELQKPLSKLFSYAKIRMSKGGRDRHLPELVKKFFNHDVVDASWVLDTDIKHTIESFNYLKEICNGESFSLKQKKILLSAILVHDCAYPVTKDFADFTSSETRLLHMHNAEYEFKKFADLINKEFNGFYSGDEINEVCAIVRQHDNPSVYKDNKYLDFSYDPPHRKLMWAHREADRLEMIGKAGFALDLLRRLLESDPWYDPSRYLNHVIKEHLVEADKYKDNNMCIEYDGRKCLYRTKTGFLLFKRMIEQRAKDYKIDNYS